MSAHCTLPVRDAWPVVALAVGLVLLCPMQEARAQDTWSTPYPGVRYLQRTTSEPNRIHATIIDLCAVGISPKVTAPADKGITTSTFASRYGVQVAINGDFYNTSTFQPIGLTISNGQTWPNTQDSAAMGVLAFGTRNQVELSSPASVVSNASGWITQALSGKPMLVEGGRVVQEACSSHFCERHPRTAVGLDASGRKLIQVVVDGRWSGVSRGMNRTELSQLMINLGADRAMNLDGGGSSAMYIANRGGVVNRPSDGTERRVSNHLGFTAGGTTDFARCCTSAPVSGATGTFADLAATNPVREAAEIMVNMQGAQACQETPRMFCPDCAMDRRDAAIMVARVLSLPLVPPASPTFADVDARARGYAEIEALVAAGIVGGCSQNPRKFCPDDVLKRSAAAIMAVRAMGEEPIASNPPTFEDIPAGSSYTGYVERLVSACVVSGCSLSPRRYCPDQPVTRGQMSTILARSLELGSYTNCLISEVPAETDAGSSLDASLPLAGDAGVESSDAAVPGNADGARDAGNGATGGATGNGTTGGEDAFIADDPEDDGLEADTAGARPQSLADTGAACASASANGPTPLRLWPLLGLGLMAGLRRRFFRTRPTT